MDWKEMKMQRQFIILQTYKKKLSTSSELITSLYKVGGNVTQASKVMYIHRNTLEYRIDKLVYYEVYTNMYNAIERALDIWYDKESRDRIMFNGMSGDYSWDVSAEKYIRLYESI